MQDVNSFSTSSPTVDGNSPAEPRRRLAEGSQAAGSVQCRVHPDPTLTSSRNASGRKRNRGLEVSSQESGIVF